ncbi:MAG: hypothetical protein R2831_01780 [Chitinophagaceae bacterium]
MNKKSLYFFIFLFSLVQSMHAQFAFELKVSMAMRIQNSDQFSVSGEITQGRIEKGKKYYLENGTELKVENIISSKSGTSVPVASAPDNVSLGISSKDFQAENRMLLRGISNRPVYGGNVATRTMEKSPEGILHCKLNGSIQTAKQISKPVYIKNSNVLDMFFQFEDKSVLWLQLNGFSEIEAAPHQTTSDTSQKDFSKMCKIAYLPYGYRPTDFPNNYQAFEDVKGHAGILITALNKYTKKIAFDFNGILRPNMRLLESNANAGLFYITEGKVDHVSWDAF